MVLKISNNTLSPSQSQFNQPEIYHDINHFIKPGTKGFFVVELADIVLLIKYIEFIMDLKGA